MNIDDCFPPLPANHCPWQRPWKSTRHIEADEFARRLALGHLTITERGDENIYATCTLSGIELYTKP